jgi:uncharacterized protein (TIGR02265 family)
VESPKERVVYSEVVEGIFLRGLGPRTTPALKEKLRALGVDLGQKLKPTYPRELWIQVLRTTVEELYPGVPLEEGYRQLGQVAIQGVANTMIGRTIASMARLLGPGRAIHRLGDGFKSVNNYMEIELETLEKGRRYRIWLNDTYGHPAYMLGCFQAALGIAGAKDLEVKLVESTPDGATFEMSWTP